VRIINGVSIPRGKLPALEEIQEYAVDNIEFDDIRVKSGPRFEIGVISAEKFGYCTAHFGPKP
jgi:hypothetical protein